MKLFLEFQKYMAVRLLLAFSIIALGGYSSLNWMNMSINDFTSIKKMQKHYVVKNWESKELSVLDSRPQTWTSLSSLNSSQYMAIVISEDWSFFDHKGIDSEQLQIALVDFMMGEPLRGASTISQQLVKNLFTDADRSLKRKVKEFILTKYLEENVSKEKILETYLNNIQYGKDIYGISDAARFYFNKSAQEMNTKEWSFMAMLLPNPVRYASSYRERKLTDYAVEKISTLLFKLKVAKVIDYHKLLEYQELPIRFK